MKAAAATFPGCEGDRLGVEIRGVEVGTGNELTRDDDGVDPLVLEPLSEHLVLSSCCLVAGCVSSKAVSCTL